MGGMQAVTNACMHQQNVPAANFLQHYPVPVAHGGYNNDYMMILGSMNG